MRYFTIVNQETLEAPLPFEIIEYMGYEEGVTLKDATLLYQELAYGNFVISVNMANAMYLKERGANSNLSEQDFEFVKQFFGEENLLTIEQYRQLELKEIE